MDGKAAGGEQPRRLKKESRGIAILDFQFSILSIGSP
jgi:hypothetical protein